MDNQSSSKNTVSPRAIERINFPSPVPFYAQTASPEWVEAVFDRGADPAGDPKWQEWDCRDAQEYAYWCPRACGPVCVKMCVEAFGRPVLPVMAWVRQGLALDGYQIQTSPDGRSSDVGWKHSALAQMIILNWLYAVACPMEVGEFLAQLSNHRLIITSVSYEIGTDRPITHSGGHLVVVTGAEFEGGVLNNLYIHNPSGRTPALRENARIPAQRFSEAYSGRSIVVSDRPFEPVHKPSDQEPPYDRP